MQTPAELRSHYDEDGFLVIQDFFDANYMNRIEAEIGQYIKTIVPGLPPERVFCEKNSGAIKSMNRLDEYSGFFRDFRFHPRFIELASNVFGTSSIVVENMQYFGKPAYEGSITPWHQDNGFQAYDPPESFMIWLALDDVTEDNGCVVFARGSHRLGTVPHKPSGVLGFSQHADPPDIALFPEFSCVMRRGSLSAHHCNTYHRSGENKTAHSRRALAINLRSERAVPNTELRKRVKADAARLIEQETASRK